MVASVVAGVIFALFFVQATAVTPITEADILNFALNLEYLEAEFYCTAAFGKGLNATTRRGGPPAIGGSKAALGETAQKIAEDICSDELTHVLTLQSVLGKKAVAMPLISLEPAFALAANAALKTTLKPSFNPFLSDITFYHGAFIFEDVGVTAYHGAVSAFKTPALIAAAAGILGVEAYHAGAIRIILFQQADVTVNPYGANVSTIVNAIAALRAAASKADVDGGVADKDGALMLVPTDASGQVFTRTFRQVLAVVYLGGSGKGGFFPKGLNGNIK